MIEKRMDENGEWVKWRMRVAYDGRPFLGWQRQEQGLTVQEALETALATALRHPAPCEAAGRTDTGVHARGQVVLFRANAGLDPARVLKSVDALLPEGASVRDLERAPEDFSARHSGSTAIPSESPTCGFRAAGSIRASWVRRCRGSKAGTISCAFAFPATTASTPSAP
jgi:tRNA pseudouridine38-40 synthase